MASKNKYRTFIRENQTAKELEDLLKAQNGAPSEEKTEGDEEAPASNPEEESFKKRYGDLRTHIQKLQKEWEEREDTYKQQLEVATKKELNFPKTREEVETWMKKYPDVAGIVKTIALEAAQETNKDIEKRLKELSDKEKNVARSIAYREFLSFHPDFEEIRVTKEFQDWINEQPKNIYDALYVNETDVLAAKRVVDLYKLDRGLIKNSAKTKETEKKGAEENVKSRSAGSPSSNTNTLKFTESMVAKMHQRDFEKNYDQIQEAMRNPAFYDLSSGAR